MISSKCAVCGKLYKRYPSQMVKTCGDPECVKKLKASHSLPRTGTCSVCGKEGKLARVGRYDGKTMCKSCLNKESVQIRECSFCGKVRKIQGFGACQKCYVKQGLNRRMVDCKKCGERKPHYAKGLCVKCYNSMNARRWKKNYYENFHKRMEADSRDSI